MSKYPKHWRINAAAAHLVPPPTEAREWYRIRNAASADTAEVIIYDEIGEWGVTAKNFIDDLNQVRAGNIDIRLNSGGGSVFEGLAIYQALRRHPANITTYIDGIAASIASIIAMAGDRRVISRNGSMMIHEASGLAAGNAQDMREMADVLNRLSQNLADVYAHRTGNGTADSWREQMVAETWFVGAEAVAAGLATETDDQDDVTAWAPFAQWSKQQPAAEIEWQRTVAKLLTEGHRAPDRPIELFPNNHPHRNR
ncbi:head maturation protease, ClpP-related [Streptomyces rochei]|uniref:head maturation protease, ClpP-related n=1 Tax=Streptomyces rochei TaxID=1928 RepID=UPI003683CD17